MKHRLAIFLPTFEKGGVERMMVNLARGIAALGNPVDFVVRKTGSPFLRDLLPSLKLVELKALHRDVETAAAIYLGKASPHVILTSKEENCLIAVKARERSRSDARIIMRVPVHITGRLRQRHSGPLKTWKAQRKSRRILRTADALIAVSHGVASDVAAITGLPTDNIHVIPNPVITTEMTQLAAENVDHRYFAEKEIPVILGIGRLDRQKNFELLIRAFAKVRSKTECRLVILGEGKYFDRLEKLTRTLKVERDVDLPGFVTNPYAYLSKSSLFVLSSDWEGSPNALTEALALGVPVVSTDCDSGPKEILKSGLLGKLVPVNNPRSMAEAIQETLLNSVEPETLKEAVREYSVERSARKYLEIICAE